MKPILGFTTLCLAIVSFLGCATAPELGGEAEGEALGVAVQDVGVVARDEGIALEEEGSGEPQCQCWSCGNGYYRCMCDGAWLAKGRCIFY